MRRQRQRLAAASHHPRQEGLATVATQVGATIAPQRWRCTTRSLLQRTTVEGTASLPAFESVLVGCLTSPFPSTKSLFLWQTTATRTNWRAVKKQSPRHADLLNDDKDDDSVASMALSSLIESDEDDDDDDASSTALGLMADGSGSQPYFQFSVEDMRN